MLDKLVPEEDKDSKNIEMMMMNGEFGDDVEEKNGFMGRGVRRSK